MITITINTDSDAFSILPEQEIASILEEYARDIRFNGEISQKVLRDINGNTVGEVKISWLH